MRKIPGLVEPVENLLAGRKSVPLTRMEAAVLTRCRSALRSQTAVEAARRRRQLSQLLEQRMEVGIIIRMPITKVFRKVNRIRRMVKDKITQITAGTTAVAVAAAAAVPTMTRMPLVHVE
jgi:hypothetical protein